MKKIVTLIILFVALAYGCNSDSDSSSIDTPTDGQGGSLAVFVLKGDYLYTVDQTDLNVFSLVDPSGPVKVNELSVGFNIETLYSDADYLYIGSQNGMYIYNIANPENPLYVSAAQHVTACDPVVSNGTHAYVTIHASTGCGGSTNALLVYDLTNPSDPQLVHQRNLTSPKGLGLYGNYLLVCDDEIKIFDITNPDEPVLSAAINKYCNDIIIRDNTLFAIGDQAIYRYTLNPNDIGNAVFVSELFF
ncbi:LVIVD repeat-containing protein [Flavobacterium rhizosphaerae]|uniref:LVIVD repeat-containing protein n=1 Tax=Flavobacterium rhizosphaerae TaxID=3163298 RepID=A0ABW8YRI1_9FLAO